MRNNKGLIEGVEYFYDENGFIDWRKMIRPEFLYVNKGWFEARNLEIPSSIDGLEDHQLTIKLGGIKELLRLRGYKSCHTSVNWVKDGYVFAKCSIRFIENYEGGEVEFSAHANATDQNTNGFGLKFLEAIAENRAFVRCVRNFLNIHIVGDEEIDKSTSPKFEEDKPKLTGYSCHDVLEKTLKDKGWADFKEALRELWKNKSYRNPDTKTWDKISQIPAKEVRKILAILSTQEPFLETLE